jgi:uncharacterized protein
MLQFSMALLIDGYNLLHVTDIFGSAVGSETTLHATRQALLAFLAAAIEAKTRRETTIVFDAAGAPPGLPSTMSHEDMSIQFARRHSSADELIEEFIETFHAPRSLIVVSSDHRVQRAARRRGAAYVDSERWYTDIKSSRHLSSRGAQPSAKPLVPLSPDQVEYWLTEFAEHDAEENRQFDQVDRGPREDATKSEPIFPPGYAEDLLGEE